MLEQIQRAVEPFLERTLTKRRRQDFLAWAGPALLCLTFIEDALRVLLRWNEQMSFMTQSMKRCASRRSRSRQSAARSLLRRGRRQGENQGEVPVKARLQHGSPSLPAGALFSASARPSMAVRPAARQGSVRPCCPYHRLRCR